MFCLRKNCLFYKYVFLFFCKIFFCRLEYIKCFSTLINLTAIFISNSVNPPFGIQSTQAKAGYKRIFMSSVFFVFSTFGEEVLIYGCMDSNNQLDYNTQAKVNVTRCPSYRFKAHTHKTFFHLCSMYLGKQSAGIWGMKCVKKYHFSQLTRGFSSSESC